MLKDRAPGLQLGPVSLQPAEFAKFATALVLAKYINSYSFSIKKPKCMIALITFILLPMMLIILQKGDWFGISLSGFLSHALSRRHAGCSSFLGAVCGDLLRGRCPV